MSAACFAVTRLLEEIDLNGIPNMYYRGRFVHFSGIFRTSRGFTTRLLSLAIRMVGDTMNDARTYAIKSRQLFGCNSLFVQLAISARRA